MTPGPWHYEVVGISGDHANPTDICEITNGYTRIAEHVAVDDAELIAAVPAMQAQIATLTELLVEASAMLNHTQCFVHDRGACPACRLESEIKQEIGE